MDQGQLVPDGLMSRLILKDLKSMEHISWLLDGRTPQVCCYNLLYGEKKNLLEEHLISFKRPRSHQLRQTFICSLLSYIVVFRTGLIKLI